MVYGEYKFKALWKHRGYIFIMHENNKNKNSVITLKKIQKVFIHISLIPANYFFVLFFVFIYLLIY